MSYDIGRIIRTIRELRVNIVGETKSPHKYLFLVTLARLYGQSPLRQNAFPLDDELELDGRAWVLDDESELELLETLEPELLELDVRICVLELDDELDSRICVLEDELDSNSVSTDSTTKSTPARSHATPMT